MKINTNQKHLLYLIRKGRDAEGWAKVSATVWPVVEKLSSEVEELVEVKKLEDGGMAKLTVTGETVLDWS